MAILKDPATPKTSWISQILSAIGAPTNANNTTTLEQWAGYEDTNAQNNPFAATEPAVGATNFNSVGVKNYPTESVGIAATATTIEQPDYTNVLADLRAGVSPSVTEAAISASPWGSHPTTSTQKLANPPAFNDTAQGPGNGFTQGTGHSTFTTPKQASTEGLWGQIEGLAKTGYDISNNALGEAQQLASQAATQTGSAALGAFFGGVFPFLGLTGPQEFAIRGLEVLAGAILFAIGLFALIAAASGKTGGDIFNAAKAGATGAALVPK